MGRNAVIAAWRGACRSLGGGDRWRWLELWLCGNGGRSTVYIHVTGRGSAVSVLKKNGADVRPCRAWGTSRDRLVPLSALRYVKASLFCFDPWLRGFRPVETSTVVIMIGPYKRVQTQRTFFAGV